VTAEYRGFISIDVILSAITLSCCLTTVDVHGALKST
jgi:hypothetical protein